MSEQIMWAISSPKGRILPCTIRESQAAATEDFGWGCRLNSWQEAEKAGYRCIRVKVQEVRYA